MITRAGLATYLHDYLACDAFQDYAPNGLQVEGRDAIRRICTAVTASDATIKEAAAWHADALLVHHGFFWRGEAAVITGMRRQRIGSLITQDMNLFAYHLPLDSHKTLGNNACLATLLGVNEVTSHDAGNIKNILWSGSFSNAMMADACAAHLTQIFKQTPTYVSGSHRPIQRIAWCSGGAEDFIEDAHRLGVDAYVSGEISERTYYQAQELQMHYFSCGHHATERYGIQALGSHLAEKFDLEHRFLDSHNPI